MSSSHYNNITGSRHSTPDRGTPLTTTSRGHFQDYTRGGSPFDSRRSGGNISDYGGGGVSGDNRQRNLSGGSGIGGYTGGGVGGYTGGGGVGGSRPSSAGSNRSSSGYSSMGGVENGSSRYPGGGGGGYPNGSATLSDRIPRTRSKLSELPAFRESLRSYSPTARRTGEDILNDLKEQMRRESDTFFNSNPETKFSSFGRKNLKGDDSSDWPTRRGGGGMDDMRNRGHHVGFPRMANWMSADDDGGMTDLTSRMAQVPNWPLSMGRRGGPFRERRGSGGSAMSATSEDDSSYDPLVNDKSSQGSGGSGGLDAVSHEIPIMIEAEAPPSMMQQQPPQQHEQYQGSGQQYPVNGGQNPHLQQQVPPANMSGPVPPLVGQVRKSPQYATRTTSAVEGGNPPEQPRTTRCASAPPQMIDQTDAPNARFASKANVTPQSRSATVPLSPHNNVAKPFVSTFKSSSPRGQDPIMEENFQQQPPPQHPQQQQQQQQHPQNHNQQQQQYPQQDPNVQQQQYNNQQNHPNYQQPQQQWSDQQGYYNQPQQAPQQQHYQEYEQPGWRQYYTNDPRGYDQDHFHQPQPQQQQHQRPSVVRNIPIFIEGQDNPIINEEKAPSLSSSPRNPPQFRQHQPQPQQQQHPSQFQQDPYWNPDQYFRSQSPFANQQAYHQPQQHQQPSNQQYYQQQQQPAYQQQPQQQYYQQQPQQKPQPQHHQQAQGAHEIPIQTQQQQQQRQPSPQPQPPPPPVKLTPLQKIDQVRTNNSDFMKQVDDFKGSKKDREFLYLDEMLTRALISLDDIDPDGNDEIRQARRSLIKDINSKISLLEKKASSVSPAPKESTPTPASTKADTKPEATGTENGKAAPAQGENSTPAENQPQGDATAQQKTQEATTSNGKPEDTKTADGSSAKASTTGDQASSTPSVPSAIEASTKTEAIPCPAPAIPLPEK